MQKDQIIQGDSIEVLKSLPSKSVDLIFADPPYFMQTSGELLRTSGKVFKGVTDEWDKFGNFKEYDDFSLAWLKECKRLLKDSGSIWVIGSFQNIYRLGFHMQNLGFWVINDVIWQKSNPVPNFKGSRLCNSHETLLWCMSRENAKYTFNYKTMKALNANKQEKSVWTLGLCTGNERLKDENGLKLHSTQKPLSLLEKIVLASSKEGDLILDPFFGTGTTGVAAKKYGRHYIGIEKNEKYIFYAKKRLLNTRFERNKYSSTELETKPPRVSLSQLNKALLLHENEELFNKKGESICTLAGGEKVYDGDEFLSIHKMSAKKLGRSNYNGWQYFYIKRQDTLIPIDKLRYEYQNTRCFSE